MTSVDLCRIHTPITISTATNQSLRQNCPRFADDDVLTSPPFEQIG